MDFDLIIKAAIFLVTCPSFLIWGIIFLVNRHKNKQVMADSAKEIHDEKGVNGKQIVSITIVALFVASILYLVISFKNEPKDIKSTATTTAPTQTAIISDNPTEEEIIDSYLEVT